MKAVLFDLDGTLLDIDVDAFLKEYFAALRPALDDVTGDPDGALRALLGATDAMCRPHPGRVNRDVFAEAFAEASGVELLDGHWERFERFYAEDFPGLQGTHGPRPGARRAVETALELDYRVAIATNPIFPREAIDERIRWANVDDLAVDHVTSYEISTACKPLGTYFLEVAEAVGVDPRECLMVGDDASLDLPAADVGMRTFYVGPEARTSADWSGSFEDLADLLRQLRAGVPQG